MLIRCISQRLCSRRSERSDHPGLDRGEARKYALSAITIDPNNQEAIALQRQVTMGKQ